MTQVNLSGYRVAILTISDKGFSGEREDASGPALEVLVKKWGAEVVYTCVIPDEKGEIKEELLRLAEEGIAELILTTGGTGFSPRDVTPEATREVIEKDCPGLAEAMRAKSFEITPHALLSRSVCGIRKSSLIINLPGSPRAACENLEAIALALPHGLEKMLGEGGECGEK
jgi:molybdenum cofactor synthesis domain-containing protein